MIYISINQKYDNILENMFSYTYNPAQNVLREKRSFLSLFKPKQKRLIQLEVQSCRTRDYILDSGFIVCFLQFVGLHYFD